MPARTRPPLQPDGSKVLLLLPVVAPPRPPQGSQAKPLQGGEKRRQQGKAELHTLGTPGSQFASLHLEHLQSIFFVNKCKSASGDHLFLGWFFNSLNSSQVWNRG